MNNPIEKTIEVGCDADRAFEIFTTEINRWWPLDAHSVSAMDGKAAQSILLDPKVGGALTEISHDGQQHRWGTVKAWEPAKRLVLAWHINTPVSEATEVELTFTPLGDNLSRVDLTHRGWEKLGDRASSMREGYNSGWVNVFEVRYAGACAG